MSETNLKQNNCFSELRFCRAGGFIFWLAVVYKRLYVCPTTKTKAPALLHFPAACGPRKCGCELLLDKLVSVCVSFIGAEVEFPKFWVMGAIFPTGTWGMLGMRCRWVQRITAKKRRRRRRREEVMRSGRICDVEVKFR